ncbi:MAG: DUF4260 domain-containing protein [Deltaproteobacteria bacterium]|nr:DUF4260 domain-containing protein [Deltaproteobacteria bacterium]MBI3390154.1 DUF4260 domain-containing protein [Deltaproteobacteria bacterium]
MSLPRDAPRIWLRIEAAAALAFAVACYVWLGRGWGLFALLFLVPDVSFVGYLGGPRLGAWVYNVAHSTIGPLALLVVSQLEPARPLTIAGLIWLAHIGFDRMLGYGLKYPSDFHDTHLGRIGRSPDEM